MSVLPVCAPSGISDFGEQEVSLGTGFADDSEQLPCEGGAVNLASQGSAFNC